MQELLKTQYPQAKEKFSQQRGQFFPSFPNLTKGMAFGYFTRPVWRQYLRLRNPPPPEPSSASYEYLSLQNKNKVRLFHIIPASSEKQVISGRMELVPIETLSETHYEAISYVWGDSHEKFNVLVHNDSGGAMGIIAISKSLNDALKRFRHSGAERTIWADGICINQANTAERGHQVKCMRRIYKNATTVIVWLGPDSRGLASLAFDLTLRLWRASSSNGKEFQSKMILSPFLECLKPLQWQALEDLLLRPWFTRVWVLQEIGVAADAWFYCGEEKIHRGCLFRAIEALENHSNLLPKDLHNAVVLIRRLETHFKFNRPKESHVISPFGLLDMTRLSAASDARDMIYSVLRHPIFDDDFIPIDYSLDRDQVYFSLAKELLLLPTNPLQLLSLVKHINESFVKRQGLMSWIPEWDVRPTTKTIGRDETSFSAGIPFQDFQRINVTTNGLHVQGFVEDTISWKSEALSSSDFPGPFMEFPKLRKLTGIMQEALFLTSPETPSFIRLTRTLIACSAITRSEAELYDGFCSLLSRIGPQRKSHEILHCLELLYPQYGGFLSGIYRSHLSGAKTDFSSDDFGFSLEAQKWCAGRSFFITEKGRYGLGPTVIRQGDRVCILFGAKVPFILRPQKKNYGKSSDWFSLCGECYVDGIMDGELANTDIWEAQQTFHMI